MQELRTPRTSRTFSTVRTDAKRERDTLVRERLEAADWADISARLTAYALRRLGRGAQIADAEDLSQRAILQLLDPDFKDWNPDVPILEHLRSTVNGLVRNDRQAAKRRKTVLGVEGDSIARLADPASLGDFVASDDLSTKAQAELRKRFAGAALETKLIDLFAAGVDSCAEHARRVGEPYDVVYRARQRLLDEGARVLTELENPNDEV
jgi:hypothetical protein